MRMINATFLALMLGACSPAAINAARAQVAIDVNIKVNVAPPPLPVYEQPPIPGDNYIWTPGFWAWDQQAADYYWVAGTWVEAPQTGLLWTPAYWGWRDGVFVFYAGYWAPQVGFYGGVDYGYGYTGAGYEGGRWDHDRFFYNRAANNLAGVNIVNVYNQTITINETNRVSYNGGDGGLTARPTAQQEAMARDHHIAATREQVAQAQAASKDRTAFAKQNHGQPQIAATSRPGDFKGPGVTHAQNAARPDAKPGAAAATAPDAADQKKDEARRPTDDRNAQRPAAEGEKKDEAQRPAAEGEKKDEARRPAAEGEKKDEARRPAAEGEKKDEARRPAAEGEKKDEAQRPAAEGEKKDEAQRPAAEGEKKDEARRPAAEGEKKDEARRPVEERSAERPAAKEEPREAQRPTEERKAERPAGTAEKAGEGARMTEGRAAATPRAEPKAPAAERRGPANGKDDQPK